MFAHTILSRTTNQLQKIFSPFNLKDNIVMINCINKIAKTVLNKYGNFNKSYIYQQFMKLGAFIGFQNVVVQVLNKEIYYPNQLILVQNNQLMFSYENLRGGISSSNISGNSSKLQRDQKKDEDSDEEENNDEEIDNYHEEQEDYEVLNKQFFNKDLKYIIKNHVKVSVAQGDITEEDTDAIVNSSNVKLQNTKGLSQYILEKGGEVIQQECDHIVETQGELEIGDTVFTQSGNLKCKYLFHTVGPIWHDGVANEEQLLAKAVWTSLELADKLELESISFQSVATGTSHQYPKDLCAETMFHAALQYLDQIEKTNLKYIRFVNIDDTTTKIFLKELKSKRILQFFSK